MKPYGIKKADRGCCVGHDKFPSPHLFNKKKSTDSFDRKDRPRKKRERQEGRTFAQTLQDVMNQ